MQLTVTKSVAEAFEIKASRIELSILADNVISNAGKAMAKRLDVTIKLVGKNHLEIQFLDDGRGISPQVTNIEDIFEMGVTTTSGSGLGLYHARKIAESIDGKLSAKPGVPRGLMIQLELTR